jgi:integrase
MVIHTHGLTSDTGRRAVPHGFRSSFRTWATLETDYSEALIEEAMGHVVGTEVRRAYVRSDTVEKRRQLMEDWANYIEPVQ